MNGYKYRSNVLKTDTRWQVRQESDHWDACLSEGENSEKVGPTRGKIFISSRPDNWPKYHPWLVSENNKSSTFVSKTLFIDHLSPEDNHRSIYTPWWTKATVFVSEELIIIKKNPGVNQKELETFGKSWLFVWWEDRLEDGYQMVIKIYK